MYRVSSLKDDPANKLQTRAHRVYIKNVYYTERFLNHPTTFHTTNEIVTVYGLITQPVLQCSVVLGPALKDSLYFGNWQCTNRKQIDFKHFYLPKAAHGRINMVDRGTQWASNDGNCGEVSEK
jgi:hypothetical protein